MAKILKTNEKIRVQHSPKKLLELSINILRTNKFLFGITLISIIRLWLTSDIKLIAIPSNTDDFHYTLLAYYIKSGDWLGPLDQLTLHTKTFFPVYLAYISKMQLPYIFMNHLIYVLSVIFAFFTIRKIIKNDLILLLGYTLVLFNPMLYAGDVSRVVREGIWVPLAILIVFLYIRILFLEDQFLKKYLYSILCGFCLGGFYLTREDGLMIFPIVGLLSFAFVVFKFKSFKLNLIKYIILLIIPLFVTKSMIYWNQSLNKKKYKVGITWEGELKSAGEFGNALSQIHQDIKISGIPYSRDTRLKLYKEVPEFAKLKQFEDIFLAWSEKTGKNQGELIHFNHALKWALHQAGYYENYKKIDEFYKNAKSDILRAYDEGRLKRKMDKPSDKKNSIALFFEKISGPYPSMLYDLLFEKYSEMIKGLNFALKLNDFKQFETHEFGSVTYGDEKVINIFKEVTNSPIAFTEEDATPERLLLQANTLKNKLMLYNYKAYSVFTQWLFYISLIFSLFIVYHEYKNKSYALSVLLSACLAIIVIRIYILVTILHTNNLFSVKYLSLVYAFIYIFVAISFGFFANYLLSIYRKKNLI